MISLAAMVLRNGPLPPLRPKATTLILSVFVAGTITAQNPALPRAVPAERAVASIPEWSVPPKLIVGIVVDQMRVDYIYRYWNNFGEGGFKRLIGEGAFLRDAQYDYVPTITGPGHASIYTGTTPSHHGIVANDRYDRLTRGSIYCAADTTVSGVGAGGAIGQRSPVQLMSTTLADEIERRTDREGRTIGVALKDRSAILPIGRTGDAAFWFDPVGGGFMSSTWYLKQLPPWVQDFNARGLTAEYLHNTWQPLLPIEKYHQALSDENPYEQPLTVGGKASFPYDLSALSKTVGPTLIASTPWGNTLTTDMALAALKGEGLGNDEVTDLLAISYSSTDILGHKMGPRALEVEDMYVRLDLELARLLTAIDQQVGAGRYTLFLTADHGAVDVPAYLKDLRASAGYVDVRDLQHRLLDAMHAEAGGVTFSIDTINDGQVFLRSATSSAREAAAQAMRSFPEIQNVIVGGNGSAHGSNDAIERCMINGYMPQRCGDLLYTLKPGYFEAEGTFAGRGTTHGSPWNYDTNVPVLFFGQGVRHTEVVRTTRITDIVPTICMIIGCALPDAASGEPVQEVLLVK